MKKYNKRRYWVGFIAILIGIIIAGYGLLQGLYGFSFILGGLVVFFIGIGIIGRTFLGLGI